MELNRNEILQGSSHKILMSKYDELMKDFSKTKALEYYLIYKGMPLSVILEHSRYIFSEPHRGMKFYKNIIDNHDIPLESLVTEVDKVNHFFDKFSSKMNDIQKDDFEQLLMSINTRMDSFKNTIGMKSMLSASTKIESESEISDIFTCEDMSVIPNLYDIKYNICNGVDGDTEPINELFSIIDNSHSLSLFIDALILLPDVPGGSSMFLKYLNKFHSDSPKDYGIRVACINIVNRMLLDIGVKDKINGSTNQEFKWTIYRIAQDEKIDDTINKITTRKADESDTAIYANTQNSVNSIYDDEVYSDIFSDDNAETKQEVLQNKKDAIDMEAQFAFIDYVTKDSPDENGEDDKYSVESVLNESAFDTLSELILESTIIEEELFEFTDGGKQPKIIGDSMNRHSENKKPVKPKQKMTTKIQTKALDTDKKVKQGVSKSNRAVQDIKNTGKAIAKVPANISDNMKRKVKEWDDMDDSKRKEFIIKPGFRKQYFRLFRLSLTHYITFLINPLFNIVLFMFQKLSAEKNIRIRNELGSELATEIKICEEKIGDASANGDNKKKYQLMRIKDKLEAEQVRIKTNTRYI